MMTKSRYRLVGNWGWPVSGQEENLDCGTQCYLQYYDNMYDVMKVQCMVQDKQWLCWKEFPAGL